MEKVFYISMDSLFPVLFWGNMISVVFLLVFHNRNKLTKEKHLSIFLIIARLCQATHYFLATGRDILPDWLSVNVGNTLLFIGFYFEAQSILRVIKENSPKMDRLLGVILGVFIVLLNVVEWVAPSGGIRITITSLGNVAIMALPVLRMLFSRDASVYTKPAAIFYVVFLALLLGRAVTGLQNQDLSILETTVLQSTTFLVLLLHLIVSLPSYTLIIKDYADEALLLMATTDRLTGATNRHAFLDAAAAVFRNGRRFHFPLAVLFLDIDRFKQVNDTFGHAFGDVVLARLATLVDRCLRVSDLSCRYGGEEFVVLLPNSDTVVAHAVAERIMHEVRQARFEERPDFTFTVSIGIYSGVPTHEQSFDDIIHAADQAMYCAKREGRDRIVCGDAIPSRRAVREETKDL